ncbi:hypothetical protein HHK36_015807 [Tetracentron sinense]|uniref:Glycosyl hydrolase family 63 C-terminal domain-containing protein n=1 Tax=Tetracentron sinense TaxID=13715 RepID=A0A834Z9Y0_TETSI|nr:hypothetical protein HHK36_015807 [Tetracentron sinense]
MQVKSGDNFVPYWPAELYTAVPSRSFFPRGFLWDEGFHQLLIWRWDIHICLDIIGHWLDLMNIDGWIPREQILGAEALSKVPEEFVPQHPTNGNPPTLFLVLRDIVSSTRRNKFSTTERNEISSFLDKAFVRLEAWFQWFNTTQLGKFDFLPFERPKCLFECPTFSEGHSNAHGGKDGSSYFWHGRDKVTTRELNPKDKFHTPINYNDHIYFASGFSRHFPLDLMIIHVHHIQVKKNATWISDVGCFLQQIACIPSQRLLERTLIWERYDNDNSDLVSFKVCPSIRVIDLGYQLMQEYRSTAILLSDFDILNQMHFDEVYGAYFDFGNHTEKVRLRWQEAKELGNNYADRELVREVLEMPQLKLVPHVGYVNLFPFMMRIIPPESWILEKQLDLISNRSTLWTDYGLRSLAKTSSLYMKRNTQHDPPYWRGPIWMNMNYMILSALHYYSQEDGPYRDRARTIYEELRGNLIRNVVGKYFQSGYLWEQYDQKNKGKGKGARPFTGWTALVLLIMAEDYSEI